MFDKEIFAQRVRELRLEKGWTQEELAEKLGLKKQTISGIENKNHTTKLETVIKLAKFFGVSVDYLLGLTDKR